MAKKGAKEFHGQGFKSNSATLVFMERYLAPTHTKQANYERMQGKLDQLKRDKCKAERVFIRYGKIAAAIEDTPKRFRTKEQAHNLALAYDERKRLKSKMQKLDQARDKLIAKMRIDYDMKRHQRGKRNVHQIERENAMRDPLNQLAVPPVKSPSRSGIASYTDASSFREANSHVLDFYRHRNQ